MFQKLGGAHLYADSIITFKMWMILLQLFSYELQILTLNYCYIIIVVVVIINNKY